jgi:PPOX class probable F420-dependent enzyme
MDSSTRKNLADGYELPLVDWQPVEQRLDAGLTQAPGTGGPDRHTWWLATIDADGSPHVTGMGADWHDGAVWFVTGRDSRKGRNLARDPRCTLSLSTSSFDVTIQGAAQLVTDPETVADVARRYADDGWPASVDESGAAITAPFSAPSAGWPPWHVSASSLVRHGVEHRRTRRRDALHVLTGVPQWSRNATSSTGRRAAGRKSSPVKYATGSRQACT